MPLTENSNHAYSTVSNFDRTFGKQTVNTLIRRQILNGLPISLKHDTILTS